MVKSPATLKEIALVAGCSPRAVAAVLNPTDGNVKVGKATQERVTAIAKEMGYRTNELARAMVSGKSRVLGVVMDTGKFQPRNWMLGGVLEEAALHGYIVKILTFHHPEVPEIVIKRALEWRLGGLVGLLLSNEASSFLSEQAAHYGIPLTLVGSMPFGYTNYSVMSDDEQGIALPIEHLVKLGHRRIGYLGGGDDSTVSRRRQMSFVSCLNALGVPVDETKIVESAWADTDVVRLGVQKILANPAPTAIVCAGDTLAMSVINGARAQGIRVPEQLSVTGFGNLDFVSFIDPPLTSIEQRFPVQGQVAIRQLICAIEGGKCGEGMAAFPKPATQEKMSSTLVLRASTGPPPPG